MSLIAPSPIFLSTRLNVAFGARAGPSASNFGMASLPLLGATANTQPVDENKLARTGQHGPGFGFLDWYNRIHITPALVALGNVVSAQSRTLRVFNAYFVPRTLTAIAPENDDGITLTEPAATPITLEPFQEIAYSFSVSTEGPPTIDATYAFSFDVGSRTVVVTGQRITAWPWAADWSRPVTERLEWLTDVLRTADGSEQAIQLREWPRRTFEFAFGVDGAQRRTLEATLYGWGARVWALPVWTDGEDLQSQIAAGASSVLSDTDTRDYHASGLIIFLAESGKFEVAEVATVNPTGIDLKHPVQSTWPAGTRIYPARTARLQDKQLISRFTGAVGYGVARFQCIEPAPGEAATETLYRGYPVMLQPTEWSQDPTSDYQRTLSELDGLTGGSIVDDETELPDIVTSYRFAMDGRAAIMAHRDFLFARAGRARRMWVPTFTPDIVPVANVGVSATNIDIERTEYTRFVGADVHRRDLRIELNVGTVLYRRIVGSSIIDDATERLTIDSALGVLVHPSDVSMVSYMALCRMESDAIELSWWSGQFAETQAAFRAIRNDV